MYILIAEKEKRHFSITFDPAGKHHCRKFLRSFLAKACAVSVHLPLQALFTLLKLYASLNLDRKMR